MPFGCLLVAFSSRIFLPSRSEVHPKVLKESHPSLMDWVSNLGIYPVMDKQVCHLFVGESEELINGREDLRDGRSGEGPFQLHRLHSLA